MTEKQKKMLRAGVGMAAGALAGFAFYTFIGCRSGACPITSNALATTLTGAVIGMLALS